MCGRCSSANHQQMFNTFCTSGKTLRVPWRWSGTPPPIYALSPSYNNNYHSWKALLSLFVFTHVLFLLHRLLLPPLSVTVWLTIRGFSTPPALIHSELGLISFVSNTLPQSVPVSQHESLHMMRKYLTVGISRPGRRAVSRLMGSCEVINIFLAARSSWPTFVCSAYSVASYKRNPKHIDVVEGRMNWIFTLLYWIMMGRNDDVHPS